MKLSDLSNLDKDDILSALGLAAKPTASGKLLGSVGIFAVGLLVGAGAALLLAPTSGQGLREGLAERVRKVREGAAEDDDATNGPEPQGEARI
jgi:hypothetical protein